jgi:nitroimidazol reductase NimA-like FMN-containing flavoprotein (pyridoxamine 5'-phosphate oxidase superfamily)
MAHDLRRGDLEITDAAEIDDILASARHATVALVDGDEPYIVTLSCGYDAVRQRLCFHVAPSGRKLDIIARNPKACATVVRDKGYLAGECAHPYESVLLFGRMRLLDDPAEVRVAMRTLIGQLEKPEAGAAIWQRNELDTPEVLVRFRMLVLEIEDRSAKAGR